MELSYIKKIIKLVENSEVDEIEIEEEGKKIRVAKHKPQSAAAYQIPLPPQYLSSQAPAPALPAPAVASPTDQKPKAEKQYHEIKSPIVGTFYRAPSPDAEPYVEVGQQIKEGDVLCIVEAMKLMNEIESDLAGKVVKIVVDNAKPVEYNQVLFLIDPS
jgi:acetyl-CoA carboxylase biotin carboxyl carrier protein